MSNDEFQQRGFWEKNNMCIEKNKDNKCLVSVSFQIIDFSKSKEVKLCDEYKKLNTDDKTI